MRHSFTKTLLIIAGLAATIGLLYFFFSRNGTPGTRSATDVKNHPSLNTAKPSTQSSQNKEIKILIAGDTMLARTVGQSIINGTDPFLGVASLFRSYDLVVVNLEANVSPPQLGNPQPGKLFTFNAPLEVIPALKKADVGLVTLANNHTMDFGAQALTYETDNLTKNSIGYFGAGKNINGAFEPKIASLPGVTIAFIGLNDIETSYTKASSSTAGSAFFDKNLVAAALQKARQKADIVIVVPHWGVEYSLNYNSRQKEFGHFFIDSGADLVVGMHPHVIEGSEEYQGKMIYYSLGNFVFDGMSGNNTDQGNVLEVAIKNRKIASTRLIQIFLSSQGFPQLKK
jgi:poly-gamma-glutamate synthesis protein (capsule biosynthesis protein)